MCAYKVAKAESLFNLCHTPFKSCLAVLMYSLNIRRNSSQYVWNRTQDIWCAMASYPSGCRIWVRVPLLTRLKIRSLLNESRSCYTGPLKSLVVSLCNYAILSDLSVTNLTQTGPHNWSRPCFWSNNIDLLLFVLLFTLSYQRNYVPLPPWSRLVSSHW